MPVVAAGLVLAGTAVAVAGQIKAAKDAAAAQKAQGERDARSAEAQARLSERNALVTEQQAIQEAQAGALDIDTLARQFRRLRGQQVAAVGAGGLELAGSPLDILAETAAEGQLDIERTRFASGERQRVLLDEADQFRFEASELRAGALDAIALSRVRAKVTRQAGTIRAIGTGLSGGGQAAGLLRPSTSTGPTRAQTAQSDI